MQSLISIVRSSMLDYQDQPFAVYSSMKEQCLLNVPIIKPLLVVVLDGKKSLGKNSQIVCHAGEFIFLSDSPSISMRNIPKGKEYLALLIEFEYQDFFGIDDGVMTNERFFVGKITLEIEKCLEQFVEWSMYSPEKLWAPRRKEIIQLMYHMGHKQVLSMAARYKVSRHLYDIFRADQTGGVKLSDICEKLAMSESTLRRKLKLEGTSVQEVKDQAKLSLGLHLLQTTPYAIGLIAEKCGYLSQSRFTDRFKGRFGLTPSELRKTKMTDKGGKLTAFV